MKKYARILLLVNIWRNLRPINCACYFTAVLMVFALQTVNAQSVNQTKIDVDFKNIPLKQALDQVQKKTTFNFVFSEEMVAAFKVSLTAKGMTVGQVLTSLLSKTDLDYIINGNKIIIRKKPKPSSVSSSIPMTNMGAVGATSTVKRIKGKVLTTDDEPLMGVNIKSPEVPGVGFQTNAEGEYSLTLPEQAKTLVFTFIGFATKEVKIGASTEINLSLEKADKNLDQVVVTGLFSRKAESFTGAASTFTQEQLRSVGNQNLLQSLKVLDPAFIQIENPAAGSDPNTLPDFQIRGANSLTGLKNQYAGNPNEPLFVLDGFETTLQKIYDLDMNRVASVTILKDASAKAIYGSRAANGVVVVETKPPAMGKLRFSYSGDFNVVTPDLTSYDLTNASEKLQVELNAGRYSASTYVGEQTLMEQYNRTYAEVARGVNTYWLSQPLNTGYGQKHMMSVEGGDPFVRYGADFSYNDIKGAMKESGRKTIQGSVFLSYRTNKFLFKNSLNVTGNKADISPYGSFSEYTSLNSYFTPYDENGQLKRILGTFTPLGSPTITYYNPLYNATLGTKRFSKYTDITNNFITEWTINKALKARGRLGYTRIQNSSEEFYPGNHLRYNDYVGDDFFRRGEYTVTDGKSGSIKADVSLDYNKQIGKHQIIFSNAWNLLENTSDSHGFTAEGFLNDRVASVNFAKQYKENGRPSGSEGLSRETGFVSLLSYSFDERFLSDFTIRRQGSSVFGSNNRWGTFWSAGLGWNIHNEKFLKDQEWLGRLKLRASTGYTGSQKFNPYQSLATYDYYADSYYDNIVGAKLLGLANEQLKWQQTQDNNFGIDVYAFDKLSVRLDYYIQDTKGLLIDLPLPGSTGFSTIKENLGNTKNTGIDASLQYKVYNNPQTQSLFNIMLTVGTNKYRLTKISSALTSLNVQRELDRIADGMERKPIIRYEEGKSPDAIWAVPSRGIDPITGSEIFVKRNGELTYAWDANDLVIVGDPAPKLRGSFGFNASHKGWGFNCYFQYKLGGDYYNQTLVDRVENVNIAYNVDRRVFADTWKQPGDEVFFKRITSNPTKTQPSSRFVQTFNELILSSANLSYDFRGTPFLKRTGFERIKVSIFTSDIARIASVKAERGLDFPYAKTYSASIQATF